MLIDKPGNFLRIGLRTEGAKAKADKGSRLIKLGVLGNDFGDFFFELGIVKSLGEIFLQKSNFIFGFGDQVCSLGFLEKIQIFLELFNLFGDKLGKSRIVHLLAAVGDFLILDFRLEKTKSGKSFFVLIFEGLELILLKLLFESRHAKVGAIK